MKKIIFSIVLVVMFLGCKKENSISPPAPYVIEGRYQYHGFNLDSTLCTSGIVDIVLNDTIISGVRDIQAVDTINSQNIEIGVSNISGFMYSDSNFYVYLSSSSFPKVLLIGKFSSGLIKGSRILEHGASTPPPAIGYYTLQKQL